MNKKILSKKKWEWKGLSLQESLIFFILYSFYYYGLLCVTAIILIVVMVVWTGNVQPVYNLTFTEMLPIILGALVFFPSQWLRKRYTTSLLETKQHKRHGNKN